MKNVHVETPGNGNAAVQNTTSHSGKLWGYALTALAQVFLLILLPYLGAAAASEHFFGLAAYWVADFFINRLLGFTAFFIPVAFFIVGCHLLFERDALDQLVRKIFITACWFFVFNIFLLNWNELTENSLAGLFPHFFHALLEAMVRNFVLGQSAERDAAALASLVQLSLLIVKSAALMAVTIVWVYIFDFPVRALLRSGSTWLKLKTQQAWALAKALVPRQLFRQFIQLSQRLLNRCDQLSFTPLRQHGTAAAAASLQPVYTTHPAAAPQTTPRQQAEPPPSAPVATHQQTGTSPLSFAKLRNVIEESLRTSTTVGEKLQTSPILDLTASSLLRGPWQTAAAAPATAEADELNKTIETIEPIEAAAAAPHQASSQATLIADHLQPPAQPAPPSPVQLDTTAEQAFGVRIINREAKLFHARQKLCAELTTLIAASPQTADTPTHRKQTAEITESGVLLEKTLNDFGISVDVVNAASGPVITCYELKVEPGIRLARIMNLADNLALALAAPAIRIVAPIPGKAVIGIELPKRMRQMVTLAQLAASRAFQRTQAALPIVLGASLLGEPVVSDLTAMPHLLVAGATGSGKSVLINTLIVSLLLKRSPNELRFLMVDPKMVELNMYNGIPHLLTPVISNPKIAAQALKWLLREMEARYRLLEHHGARNLTSYHERLAANAPAQTRTTQFAKGTLPYIVVIIDEFADLMMTARREVEDTITRLAAMSRAVGIHLVLATQRPSVDVITGVIKANFPSRIAFQVSSKIDSRTIIDGSGAEKLLGKGDMLFQSATALAASRIQGAFMTDNAVQRLVAPLRQQSNLFIQDSVEAAILAAAASDGERAKGKGDLTEDVLFNDALSIAQEEGKISASYLQRRLKIGYNRAARIVELMEEKGYISAAEGAKPRTILR